MSQSPHSISALVLWTFFMTASVMVAANEPPFSIRQIADTRLINRHPEISSSGLVAWKSFDPRGQLISGTEIFVYRDGETFSISEGVTERANFNPRVYSNSVVWVASITGREPGQESTWVLFDPELDDDIPELDARFGITEETDNPIDQQILIPLGEERDGDHFVWRRRAEGDDAPRVPRRQPTGDNEIMYWNNGDLTRLTVDNRNDLSPSIWGDTIAWQKARGWPFGWEIMVWVDGQRMQMTTNYWYDMAPRVHDRQVVWYGWDGTDYEIFKYDHNAGTTTQITENNFDDVSPQIWDGVVVWEGFPSLHADIFMWRDGEITQLSYNVDDDINPSLWNGQVVWQGFDGDFFQISSVPYLVNETL